MNFDRMPAMELKMSSTECKHALRRLELEAYCSVISALRAQGDLTIDKRRLLKDLQGSLRISLERHRAEVRRAVNDDRLKNIADSVSDEVNVSAGWQLEGRRLVPVLPRLLVQSVHHKSSEPKVHESLGNGSPGDKQTKSCNEGAVKDCALTNATLSEAVQRKAFNHDCSSENLSLESQDANLNELLHLTSPLSGNQSVVSRLFPLPSELTPLSQHHQTHHQTHQTPVSSQQSESHSSARQTVHLSQGIHLTSQSSSYVHQMSQFNSTFQSSLQQLSPPATASLSHTSLSQQSVSHNLAAVQVTIQSQQIPVASQPSSLSTATSVSLSRSASVSSTRSATHHVKSAPTPKVIIVSGTGMSTATTISGPPPPTTTSTVAPFAPKQSPNKVSVTSISKTTSDSPISAASSAGIGSMVNLIPSSPLINAPPNVRTLPGAQRMFTTRTVPIIRPRLNTLTARIRTSQPSMSSGTYSLTPPNVACTSAPCVTTGTGPQFTRSIQKFITSSHSGGSSNALTSQCLNIQLKNVRLMTPGIQIRPDNDKKLPSQNYQATAVTTTLVKTSQSLPTAAVPAVFVKVTQALQAASATSLAKITQSLHSSSTSVTHAMAKVTQSPQVLSLSSVAKATQPLHVFPSVTQSLTTAVVPSALQAASAPLPKIFPKSASQASASNLAAAAHLPAKTVTIQSKTASSSVASNTAAFADIVSLDNKFLHFSTSKAGVTTSGGRIILSDSGGVRRNVIVVQKPLSADKPSISIDISTATSKTTSPFEKELVSFIQRQDSLPTTFQSVTTASPNVLSASTYISQTETSIDFASHSAVDSISDYSESAVEFRASKHSADISTDSADSDDLGHISDSGEMTCGNTEETQAYERGVDSWSMSESDSLAPCGDTLPVFVEQSVNENPSSPDLLQCAEATFIKDNMPAGSSEHATVVICNTESCEPSDYADIVNQPLTEFSAKENNFGNETCESEEIVGELPVDEMNDHVDVTQGNILEAVDDDSRHQPPCETSAFINADRHESDTSNASFHVTSASESSNQLSFDVGYAISNINENSANVTVSEEIQTSVDVSFVVPLTGLVDSVSITQTEVAFENSVAQALVPPVSEINVFATRDGSDDVGSSEITAISRALVSSNDAEQQAVDCKNSTTVATTEIDEVSNSPAADSVVETEVNKVFSSYNVMSTTMDNNGDVTLSAIAASSGRRKRKPSSFSDDLLSLSASSEWHRLAQSLLDRIMRFRGANGEKSKNNPAAWFNQPVDANDVPDYYEIIKHPMDFNTIKHKLESGVYNDLSSFHADMLLVKGNCQLYNAMGTQVRHDCELVFNFYEQEFSKIVGKLSAQENNATEKRTKYD